MIAGVAMAAPPVLVLVEVDAAAPVAPVALVEPDETGVGAEVWLPVEPPGVAVVEVGDTTLPPVEAAAPSPVVLADGDAVLE